MSTVRFAQVVAQAGQPEPYTLWAEPKKDADFQKMLKHDRVMTVHQETAGAKKDYGEIGYTGDKSASLLVFPKSLRAFAGKRVIGVKYDLLEPVKTAPPRKETASPKPAPRRKAERPETAAAPPKLRVFVPGEDEPQPRSPAPADASREVERLRGEMRKAIKALAQGKDVAAYQLLERALGS